MAAEYIVLSVAMHSLLHLRNIHHEVVKESSLPLIKESSISSVYEDNQACIILATTDPPRHMSQSRIIAVKYHWFWAQLSKDTIHIVMIDGKLQKANNLTKALPRAQFESERKILIGW